MINEAIERITNEMMKLKDPLVQMIEEHLTEICINDHVAEKLLQEDKTLSELKSKIWSEAGRRRNGNGAHIPDSEIYEMAEAYYGITEDVKSMIPGKTAPVKATPVIDISQFL